MEPRGTIVVVDDEADVSRYLSAALEDVGYEVHVGGNAEEGLALIRDVGPGLVCLDLVMPGRTGISLYLELRGIPELAGIPTVVRIFTSSSSGNMIRTGAPPMLLASEVSNTWIGRFNLLKVARTSPSTRPLAPAETPLPRPAAFALRSATCWT